MKDILKYTDILMYESDISKEDKKNIELLLNKIFNIVRNSGLKSLTCDQLHFIIWCFFIKIDDLFKLVLGDDDGTIETDDDVNKEWVEFDSIFISAAARIQSIVYRYYREQDKEKLIKCTKDVTSIYKEAKQWMTKKGYEV